MEDESTIDSRRSIEQMHRTVADLRPRPGLALDPSVSVAAAARKMSAAGVDSGLIVSSDGQLQGILTDTDVACKVLALGLDANEVLVSTVMTAGPHCVHASDSAVDALCTMVERRFRHLPVLDANGSVVGMLDIAKCLYDAISRLERHLTSASSALSTAVLAAMPNAPPAGSDSAQRIVDGMVQKLFAPPLSGLLQQSQHEAAGGDAGSRPRLQASESILSAATLMATTKAAVLISSPSVPLAGILTPKDLLFKVGAKGLPPATTSIDQVAHI